jgi:hypothetical protein
MTILDSRGRLFGKVSILDIGAALVILLVVAGIFLLPGPSGTSIAQIGSTKTVEVEGVVRGLSVRDPDVLIGQFIKEKKTKINVRNQEYSQIEIKSVKRLEELVTVPQPDGTVKALPDPRPYNYGANMLITLSGQGRVTDKGPVLGNNPVKIGTVLELEGSNYNFKVSIIDVKVQ